MKTLKIKRKPFSKNTIEIKGIKKLSQTPIPLFNHLRYSPMKLFRINFLFIWIFLSLPLFGQKYFSSQQEMDKALMNAERFMIAQQGDSAILITQPLLIQLKNEGRFDSHFSFQVRMVHGLALYHSTEEIASLDFLWKLKDESRKHQEWAVYANICRDIAKIQEINRQPEEAYKNLQEAKTIIDKYKIDSIYAAFAVRYSSWHRVYGITDSARYYAEIAVQKAQLHRQYFEEAEGFLILSLIEKDETAALPYGLRALNLYQKLNVYTSATSMHQNVSNMYLALNKYQKALQHIDTAILYTRNYLNNSDFYNYYNYYLKAYIYRKLDNIDSVLFYTTKSNKVEVKLMENDKQQQIIEISKKYNFDKKNQELKSEKLKSRWLFFSATLFIVFGFVITFYYLKLRKANEISRKQSEELKVLDQTKTRFFANISHELRTPLTLISGSITTLIKENQIAPKQEKLLKIAHHGTTNLKNLINEILDLSKMDAGKMELILEPTPIAAFFEHYLKQYESLLESKDVHYQYIIKVQSEFVAMIDREKMRQILFNLLSNAGKFTPLNGKVNVVVQIKNNQLLFQVADTGNGIHPDDLPHIFDRYFQTKQKDTVATGGTGIGLAICNEYSKLFGGKISVNSQLGVGTTFDVEFPIEEAEQHTYLTSNILDTYNKNHHEDLPLKIETIEEHPQNLDQPALLLVEDNLDLQKYISLILQKDYQVITAGNGQKALEMLHSKQHKIDLIISDLMMPVMDGYQFLKSIKSSRAFKYIPTIMLTARVGKDDRLQALRIGVDNYLTKPFDEEELKIHIKNLLNNQAVRIETQKEIEQEAKLNKSNIETNKTPKEKTSIESDSSSILSLSEEKMIKIEAFVKENISNTSLSVSLLEDKFAMSESTLLRFLKQHSGLSSKKYITEIRLGKARNMLESGQYESISLIAKETGYTDIRTFSRSFKTRFGKLPSEVFC